MIENIIQEEAKRLPELTDADIEELRKECNYYIENDKDDFEYQEYLKYSYENKILCPYCGVMISYQDNIVSCETNKCFKLKLGVPVRNMADIAWKMRTINEAHK